MPLVENEMCTICGGEKTFLPIKSKVKLEPLAFCPSCDPNVVKFWEKRGIADENDDGA